METAVSRCLVRPEIYDVQLRAQDSARWVVYVAPNAERCRRWRGSFGGDATYEISKADGRIRAAEFGE